MNEKLFLEVPSDAEEATLLEKALPKFLQTAEQAGIFLNNFNKKENL